MSRRVKRRTVVGYVQASRYQLERAIAAAVKCNEIAEAEWFRLRHAWKTLDDLTVTVSRKSRKKPK